MTQKADSLPYCTKVPKGSLISFLGSIAIHTLPLTSLGLNGALSRNGPGRDDWLWPIYLKAHQWGQPCCWAVWEWSGQSRNCFVLPTPSHGVCPAVITSCCTSCVPRSCPSHSFQRCPRPHSPSRSRDQEQAALLGEQETVIRTLANFSERQKLPKGSANPWDNLEVKKLSWDRIHSLCFLYPLSGYSTPTSSRPRCYISSLHFIEVFYLWQVCVLTLLSNEEGLSHFKIFKNR